MFCTLWGALGVRMLEILKKNHIKSHIFKLFSTISHVIFSEKFSLKSDKCSPHQELYAGVSFVCIAIELPELHGLEVRIAKIIDF